jgi:hypothetical protein
MNALVTEKSLNYCEGEGSILMESEIAPIHGEC